jgi:hypothetical protein
MASTGVKPVAAVRREAWTGEARFSRVFGVCGLGWAGRALHPVARAAGGATLYKDTSAESALLPVYRAAVKSAPGGVRVIPLGDERDGAEVRQFGVYGRCTEGVGQERGFGRGGFGSCPCQIRDENARFCAGKARASDRLMTG